MRPRRRVSRFWSRLWDWSWVLFGRPSRRRKPHFRGYFESLEQRRVLDGSISGFVFNDLNADGFINGQDTGTVGRTVYIDRNLNSVVDSGPILISSPTLGATLPDLQTTTIDLPVSDVLGTLQKVTVSFDITHTLDRDLDIYLVSPAGTTVTLVSRLGGQTGQNFTNTVLDDAAASSINSASAPFTGSFQPASPLSAMNGESINGTWRLQIADRAAGDVGILNNFSLTFTNSVNGEYQVQTAVDGSYSFVNLPAASFNIKATIPASTVATIPSPSSQTITLATDEQRTLVNFGYRLNPGAITGLLYNDANADGFQESNELGVPGFTVYVDTNLNGQFDANEPSSTTDSVGKFVITPVPPGSTSVSFVQQTNWQQTGPVNVSIVSSPIRNATFLTGNQFEPAVAINPYNAQQQIVVSSDNGAQLVASRSSDGGATYTTNYIATGTGSLPQASGSPALAWDNYGNLFLAYRSVSQQVVLAYSVDAGQTFNLISSKNAGSTTAEVALAAANDQVWIGYNTTSGAAPGIYAAGTPVLGTGVFGTMQQQQSVAGGSLSGAVPSLAIGTAGDVLVAYQSGTSAQGLTTLMVARDPDGLGSQIFQAPVSVTTTNVGQADTLLALTRNGIDAAPTLLVDRSNGPARGRVYLFYTTETPNESGDFDINFVSSVNDGASWSLPSRVNSISVASQFMPRAAIDNLTGYIFAAWYDTRNSPGNNTVNVYGSLIYNGGGIITTNQLISSASRTDAGTSATGLLQLGSRLGVAFDADEVTVAWADNGNSPTNNAGLGSTLDVDTRRIRINRSIPSSLTINVPTVNLVTNAARLSGNQFDPTVAIDPNDTNQRIFFATDTNGPGSSNQLTFARTSDAGQTYASGSLAFRSGTLPQATSAPSAAWDNLGNLFVGYVDLNGTVDLLLSRDAGQTFTLLNQFPTGFTSGSTRASVSVTASNNEVWVAYIGSSGASTLAYAASAPTIAGGTSGPFTIDFVPGSVGAQFPSVAIGTSGAALLTYQVPSGASNPQGPANIMVAQDTDGTGPLRFSNAATITAVSDTNVGFADTITPMNTKGVNAGQTVLWNQTAGSFPNRAYLIYSDESSAESNDLDVFIKYSDDNGQTWSAPQQVNDDGTSTAQFLPYAALDATTGNIFVAWFDGRNNLANTTVRTWGTLITDGGQTVTPNVVLSNGNINANVLNALPNQLGNRLGVAFVNGVVETYWPDNSNSTNNNLNGTLNQFDIYRHTLDVAPNTSGGYTLSLLPPAAVNNVTFGNLAIGNVAPFLDISGTFSMTSLAENDSDNSGTLVTALLASSSPQAIVDFNVNDPKGIALTNVDTSLGAWQYTLDGGSTWRYVNAAADTHALLLPADALTRIRLLPNANLSGLKTAAISFRAWDQTLGMSGTYQDASQANSLSAFSLNTASAQLTITPVNTPPVIRVPFAQGVRPGGGLVFSSAVDNAITISDVESDSASPQATVAVTLQASHGVLTLGSAQGLTNLSGNGTSTLIFNGTTSDVTSDLLGLLFTPDVGYSGDAQIQISVNDSELSPGPAQQASATIAVSVRNLVSVESGTLIITGTTADDVVALSLTSGNINLNVNGTAIVDTNTSANFPYMPIRLITGGGFDSYSIQTAATADNVQLQTYRVNITNSTSGYSVEGGGAQTIIVFGQSVDTGQVYDTPGNDVYYGLANSGFMVGSGQRLLLSSFGVIDAYTVNGGADVAQLFDTPAGAETFIAQPGGASMQGSGFTNRASYFKSLFGFASGSNDSAQIYGSVSDDVLGAVPAYTIISSTNYYAQATGFGNVYAFGNGGYDIAVLYDSDRDDQYVGLSNYSVMSGFGYFNQTTDFDSFVALAVFGGSDQAQLYDSAANDNFVITSQVSYVFAGPAAAPTYSNQAWNFKQISALSTIGGTDTVSLIDSSGDDFLYAASYFAILTMPTLTASVSGFAFVNAFSLNGGNDSRLVQNPNYVLSITGPFVLIG